MHMSCKKKRSMALYAITLSIALTVYCAGMVVPFLKDYISHSIVQIEGIYTNSLGNKSASPSSRLGMYSVTIKNECEELALTTCPLSGKNFPIGKYQVVAWYLPNSQYLVHIEIVNSQSLIN